MVSSPFSTMAGSATPPMAFTLESFSTSIAGGFGHLLSVKEEKGAQLVGSLA